MPDSKTEEMKNENYAQKGRLKQEEKKLEFDFENDYESKLSLVSSLFLNQDPN